MSPCRRRGRRRLRQRYRTKKLRVACGKWFAWRMKPPGVVRWSLGVAVGNQLTATTAGLPQRRLRNNRSRCRAPAGPFPVRLRTGSSRHDSPEIAAPIGFTPKSQVPTSARPDATPMRVSEAAVGYIERAKVMPARPRAPTVRPMVLGDCAHRCGRAVLSLGIPRTTVASSFIK